MLKQNERLDDLQFNNLFIIQNPELYCFTSDAVELCNFVKCGVKDRIVDLCSGSGIIGILAQAKTNAKQVYFTTSLLKNLCIPEMKESYKKHNDANFDKISHHISFVA